MKNIQPKTDRDKVNLWLNFIGETDESCREEVLQKCAQDREARAYFVQRYIEIESQKKKVESA